jgi:hemerythrin
MALLQWNDKFSVNVAEIDSQHKTIIELINSLFDAMKAGKGNLVIEQVLDNLSKYTFTHFNYEERYMRITDYPGYDTHKKEHDMLKSKVKELQKSLQTNSGTLSIQVMDFLKNWLTNHIMQVDKAYSEHFNKKNIR